MYIAVAGNGTGRRYELRRTVKGPHGLAAERLLDLGKNPAGLVRFERAGIIYAPEVQEGLAGFDVDLDALDQAFSIFAPQGFTPPPSRKVWKRTVLTETEKDAIRAVPAFDRRRVAYLRSGEVNLSRIDEVNPRLFRRLPHQCRDEREHMFRRMEAELPRREIRRYIYAVFNLQRHFMDRAARNMPESLDPARLDEVFLHEFCLLWEDRIFDPHGEARESLRRYACMHFDFDFAPDDDFGRIFHEFMNDFRRLRKARPAPSPDMVRELFGLDMADIRRMPRKEFARLFRQKAMSAHPDKGGDHEHFVLLLDAYRRIVATKPE
ncbi:hypothetical protein [Desulfomicrobium orale]|uniref:J domain-containing protein n=1 Tax=Desulfomicrobium orale DSM 12838 TaxID=888061 RepID=A0A0X8JQW2_9BACT|nr:hypothetical protein [Desulfomicrobium orale]AMD93255.1 hypothetical protein AXF15_09170 [Desulfomicrobium orale DSM 12838]